jgi:hypothetical protein
MENQPPRRAYAAPGTEPTDAVAFGKPRVGHGTVYVNQLSDGTWVGSWQDDIEHGQVGIEDTEGSREAVVAWAPACPAERHVIFSASDDDYIDLAAEDG